MTLMFKYKSIERPTPYLSTYAPAIPVTLRGLKERVKVIGLLDSGADVSFIPNEMAEVMRLKSGESSEEIGGIGGTIKARKSRVEVSVGKGREQYIFPIEVYVAESVIDDDFPLLIGRADFFNKFRITFAEAEKKVYLKKVHQQE